MAGRVAILVVWLGACGTRPLVALDARPDSGQTFDARDAGTLDAAGVACGDARCAPSEICLFPACGCIQDTDQPTDAGTCRDGETFSDALDVCFVPPNCRPPSCASPDPGTGSFDCSDGDAGAGCGTVSAPIPDSCSRTCRSICL